MKNNFTQRINNDFSRIETDECSDAELLNNYDFRTFSEGLTKLIHKNGFRGNVDSVSEKADYLYKKCIESGTNITVKATVKKWFSGTFPNYSNKSREYMHEICFALNAPLEDVYWFFSHVYFERAFNCHIVKEAVYYYSFKKGYSFAKAKELIKHVDEIVSNQNIDDTTVFTSDIKDELDRINTDTDLFEYFVKNGGRFKSWNKKAFEVINAFTDSFIDRKGIRDDKKEIDKLKKLKNYSKPQINTKNCSLVIKELLHDNSAELVYSDHFKKKHIDSIDFMLYGILFYPSGIKRDADAPQIVKCSFPNKEDFSKFLKNHDTSTSYDAVRKILVLFKFYDFWCRVKLEEIIIPKDYDKFDLFVQEMKDLLLECGYEELYWGNPYDWMFLYSSRTDSPLDTFRGMLDDFNDDFVED